MTGQWQTTAPARQRLSYWLQTRAATRNPQVAQNRPMEPLSASSAELGRLYRSLRKPLLAFLRKHTGDAQVAEDLLHDVVLKALAAGRDARTSPHNLSGWLYAVARNAAMDHHRRTRPTEELPEDLRAPAEDENERATAELSSCLRPLAERLPRTYRATLIAAEFEGLPLAEVARWQGISLSAAKTRASRGRRLLREQLVACCRVALSAKGQVLDYGACEAANCNTAASACGPRSADGPITRAYRR